MSPTGWVSLVALLGWLVLLIGAVRSQGIGRRRMLVLVLAWGAIFLFVTAIISVLGAGEQAAH